MSRTRLDHELIAELTEELEAIAIVSRNPKAFAAMFEAYRAGDVKALQSQFRRLKLFPRCRLVCDWLCSKECVLLCQELCPWPPTQEKIPDPRRFAAVVAKLTSDPAVAERLAATVEKRDAAGFQALVKEHGLEPYCHLLCRWVCAVRCRLVCRIVCEWQVGVRPNLGLELQVAGGVLRTLAEKPELLDRVVEALEKEDGDGLAAALQPIGALQWCHLVCEWFCAWHCVRRCLPLCRRFEAVPVDDPITEARDFARATQVLLKQPEMLRELAVAVVAGDADRFEAVVRKLKLDRYCLQLCHWVWSIRCRLVCRLRCRPIYDHPWFTHIGDFGIAADITPATGLTNKAVAGHGGPGYGFFGALSLRGYCPKRHPLHPTEPMKYRFLFVQGTSRTPVTAGFVSEVLVGSRYVTWDADGTGLKPTLQSIRIRSANPTADPPPFPGGAAPWGAPPDHYVVPDANGWVVVDANAIDDGYNGWLMGFDSAVAFPGGDPAPGVSAGTDVPAVAERNGIDVGIVFEATRVSNPAAAAADYTNGVDRVRVSNWGAVMLLDLLQFHSGGGTPCSPLASDLDIEYTTDHELLAAWSVSMVTAAAVSPAPTFPSGTGPRGGFGVDHHDISGWPTCSYAIQLHARRSLTTGLADDSGTHVQKTFCIGKRRIA